MASMEPAILNVDIVDEDHADDSGNTLKLPLLNKVVVFARPLSEEEAAMEKGWVYATTFIAVMGIASLGFGLGYSSPVQVELTESLDLSVSQFSFFGSLITLGAMAGSVVSGPTAEYLGRKGAMLVISSASTVGFVLLAIAKSTILLFIGRFATGVAGGLSCYVAPVLVAEIAPGHMRGLLGTMQQIALTLGIFVAYLLGLFMNWRILAAAGIVPSLVCFLGLIFIPESPRWLAKVGKEEKIEASLKQLRGKNYDISEELREIKASAASTKDEPKPKLTDLFKKRYARPLMVGFVAHALMQCTGINGVMLYSGSILMTAGISNANVTALSLAALQVAMTVVSAVVSDKAGRRALLLVSLCPMTLCHFLVGLSFFLRQFDELMSSSAMTTFVNILTITFLLLFVATFSVGQGPVPWILMGEIFPPQVKGIAGSMATLVNWSNAWIVTWTFNFVFTWSAPVIFWIYCSTSLLGAIFVFLFVPETRGKSLEEIEQLFK